MVYSCLRKFYYQISYCGVLRFISLLHIICISSSCQLSLRINFHVVVAKFVSELKTSLDFYYLLMWNLSTNLKITGIITDIIIAWVVFAKKGLFLLNDIWHLVLLK